MSITGDARFHSRPHVGWVVDTLSTTQDFPTVYVAPFPEGPALVLEGTGSVVWLSLDDGASVGETITLLAEGTGTDRAVVAPAVASFVESLLAQRLIEARDGH